MTVRELREALAALPDHFDFLQVWADPTQDAPAAVTNRREAVVISAPMAWEEDGRSQGEPGVCNCACEFCQFCEAEDDDV